MSNDLIFAPFTPDQVEKLNRWQHAGTVHEFTCPAEHKGTRILIAREDGWFCPSCSYVQTWAHRMMLTEPPKPFFGMVP